MAKHKTGSELLCGCTKGLSLLRTVNRIQTHTLRPAITMHYLDRVAVNYTDDLPSEFRGCLRSRPTLVPTAKDIMRQDQERNDQENNAVCSALHARPQYPLAPSTLTITTGWLPVCGCEHRVRALAGSKVVLLVSCY